MKSGDSSLFVPKNALFLPKKSFSLHFCYNESVRKKTNKGGLKSEKRIVFQTGSFVTFASMGVEFALQNARKLLQF